MFSCLFRNNDARKIDALQSTIQEYLHDNMSPISHIQMCHCTVFDSSLERFVAVDRGHRFDEEEGHCSRDASEEEKGYGWTRREVVRIIPDVKDEAMRPLREPSCFLK